VLMGQIKDYLASGLASPFAALHVIHPVYERIRIEARVAFRPERDPGYYSNVLNDDLQRFLSPWAYEDGEDILFGAKIYRSEILAFMEGRDYVDYVIGFNLYHSFQGQSEKNFITHAPLPAISEMRIGDDFVVGHPIELAETTQDHAILVSHSEHLITSIGPLDDHCVGVVQLGIGYMTISLDFRMREGGA
jgi:hypothetical protein